MSRRNGPKLYLKLNMSSPSRNPRVGSPNQSATASPTSPPSSCVSLEMDINTNSCDTSTSMVLVGCPTIVLLTNET
ncbi:hypothetical protein F3Y22_tig00109983pilonHSYRG00076 [Hibiscus syriacus]|uniref:Uncharacterized protein n=1 Tax=Hibiscus syriacus TaxID=106335 RepID=A0A6A3BQT6_HIBSY|nr:hypothetical protein F3Y22_tig00109983pilonHSYRG00076 [Hibiscus syriacus]